MHFISKATLRNITILAALTLTIFASQSIAQSPKPQTSIQDSTLRTGVLPNGLRYYVKQNKTPAKRAMLWLAVAAGSVHENDDQRGYAHFLEHMAFNGTRSFPKNSLISFIEQTGMSFGGDLNAYTSFDRTVYQLTIPTDDNKVFQNGMQIIDDWVNGGMTMDSMEVVGERGVVIGEWRMRLPDTASVRFQRDNLERTFGKGSRFADRLPIGLKDQLETANSSQLIKYYQEWYRPERIAVIVVGDFDIDKVEKDVIKRFSKTKASAPAPDFPDLAVKVENRTVVHVVRDKIRPQLDLTWPAEDLSLSRPDSAMRHRLIEEIFLPTLQGRLSKLVATERRPFAGIAIGRQPGLAEVTGDSYILRLAAAPDSLLTGLATALTEVERIAQHGLSDEELEFRKNTLLRRYEAMADATYAVNSRSIAELYVKHYLDGRVVLWNPANALRLARSVIATISASDLKDFAAKWRNEAGRIVTVHVPATVGVRPFSEEEVYSVLSSASSMSVAGYEKTENFKVSSSVIADLPAANPVLSETIDTKTEIVQWKLANGATAVFKQTSNNPDALTVHAFSLGGHSLLPDTLFYSPGRLVASLMTSSGGLANTEHADIEKMLSTTGIRNFSVGLNAFSEEVVMTGSPKDLDLMFQLLHAQFTRPTFDTHSLNEWRQTGAASITISQNDRMALNIARQRRLMPPDPVNVRFLNPQQALSVYNHRFGDASDFTFYIVGAASAETIRPLVEQYLANLPSTNRKEKEVPRDLKVPLIKTRSSVSHKSPSLNAEQAKTQIAYQGLMDMPSGDYVREMRKMFATSIILSYRIRNKLREEMAVTYSASAPLMFYEIPDERYVMSISFLTSPDDMEKSREAVWGIINDIRDVGPTAEEVRVAEITLRRRFENARQSNGWWLSQMQKADKVGIPYGDLIGNEPIAFSVEEIRETANKILSKDYFIEQTVLPTKETLEKSEKRN